jgi:hypothetical protein
VLRAVTSETGGSLRTQLFLLAAVAVPACSLFVTIPDSLTEPSGGTTEAGPSTGDAASSGDATPQEGGGEGGAAAFACPPGGSALFCDDFDHGAPLTTWDRVVQGTGFGASVDTGLFETSPGSLLAHIDSTVTDNCAYGRVEKEIAGAFTRVRLAVDLRAEGPEEVKEESLATIGVSQANKDVACAVLVDFPWDGSAYTLLFHEQVLRSGNVDDTTHETPVRIPPKTWQRVDLEIDYGTQKLVLRDGSGATVYQDALGRACPASPGAADVDVGFHCSQVASFNRRMHADNVVFDAH